MDIKLIQELPMLTLAVIKNNIKVVEYLITQGHDVNSSFNQSNKPALYYAQSAEMVEVLLKAGAEVIHKKGKKKVHLLMKNPYLWRSYKFSPMVELSEKYDLKLTPGDYTDIISKHFTDKKDNVVLVDGVTGIKKLIELGIDAHHSISNMICDIKRDDVDEAAKQLDFLLTQVPSSTLFKGIDEALMKDEFEEVGNLIKLLTMLIQKGFKPVTGYYFVYDISNNNCSDEWIKLWELLSSSGVSIPVDYLTYTIAEYGSLSKGGNFTYKLDTIRYLLQKGVPVTKKNKDGNSPLSLALKYDLSDVVELLIKEGYNKST